MPYSPRSRRRSLRAVLGAALLVVPLILSACGSGTPSGSAAAPNKDNVSVLYAGSLVNIMEHQVGPAFDKATGYHFEGQAGGSIALANAIKDRLRTPDVFISVDPKVNRLLMGAANGNYVSWYLTLARTELVIGYNPHSRFAADFQAAARGAKPWYQVLEEPGLRLGRTDPLLDPKGYNTLFLFQLAQRYYHQPGLAQKILGSDENPSQIFPEEELVARLGAGQLDAGIFYLNEVKEQHLLSITLPAPINLGDPSLAPFYATARWTNPKTGKVIEGAPVLYTITIPSTVKNRAGAVAFVNYLLAPQGQSMLAGDGILQTPIRVYGEASAVPQQLQRYIQS
jgi:molybdate/tungstate transport system substrate-binding protein